MKDVLNWFATQLPNSIAEKVQDTPIDDAFQWARLKTATRETVEVSTPAGPVALTIPESTLMYDRLHDHGTHEPGLSAELLEVLSEDSVFYDIGSQYGFFINFAQQVGVPDEQIHGFEADWFTFQVLADNHVNDRTSLTHCWVGADASGEQVTIDDYVTTHAPPTVVKIDVEGAEYGVLEGMSETLHDHRPRLYVETHPQFLPDFGRTDDDVIEVLRDAGYQLDMLDHRADNQGWTPVMDAVRPTHKAYLIRATTTKNN